MEGDTVRNMNKVGREDVKKRQGRTQWKEENFVASKSVLIRAP